MAEHTQNAPTKASNPRVRNPYEDADPIPMRRGTSRKAGQRESTPSARGAQGRHTRVQAGRQAPDARADGAARSRAERDVSDARRPRPARPQPNPRVAARTYSPRPESQGRAQAAGSPYAEGPYRNNTAGSASGSARRVYRQGQAYTLHTRRKVGFGIIAAAILCAIAMLGAMLWWLNRPVPITVDGEGIEVRIGSSLDEVAKAVRLDVTPGDYVSVLNEVISEGKGHAYTVTIDGSELSPDDAASYRVKGDETIGFSDGSSITEPYTATTEPIMPYLRMEGGGYVLQYISQWGYAGELEHRTGEETGQKADVVTKEAQDCVITCMDPYLDNDRKLVALTFDDGPSDPYTEQYLEILEAHDVKATFFNLGENAESYPAIAKRVVEAGHQLCNHTMAHNQLTAVDEETVYDEITRSAKALEEAAGVRTTHIRPPYGDFTERSWLGSGGSITASIRWTGDSQDWALPGSDAIVSNSLINLHSGTIILMHDGGGDRSQDVAALPVLIEELQAQGYEFVTISDLMRAVGTIPEDICSGTGTMPKDAVWPKEIAPEDIAASEAASS